SNHVLYTMLRIIIIICCSLALMACGSQEETTTTEKAVVSTNPNGDSELAVLMRDMFTDSWKARQAVLRGDHVKLDAETLARIHSAQATEPDKAASPVFKAMADSYLLSVNDLLAAEDSVERVAVYTRMVGQCEVCHKQFCPGPLMKIGKLKL
ncbi:MAG: hypothetical protein AB8F95_11715, partial [Bacteroidia bacterium]